MIESGHDGNRSKTQSEKSSLGFERSGASRNFAARARGMEQTES